MNSAIKFLYNSLVDLSEEGHEVLSYGIFPFKRKYHVVRPRIKSKASKILKYFLNIMKIVIMIQMKMINLKLK